MKSWQDDQTGNTISSNALTGRTAMSMLRNQGFASRVVSLRVSEQDVVEANKSADAAHSEAVSASAERSAMLTDVFSKGIAKLHSGRHTSGATSSSFEELGSGLDRLNQITSSIAERTGLTQAQVAQIAFGAAGSAGLKTPFGGAQARGHADKSYQAGLSADQQKALNHLTNEQLGEFKRFGDRVSRDTGFLTAIANDNREANEMSSRLGTVTSHATRAEANYAERMALAERLSSAREHGETISIDIAQDPHNLEMFRRYSEEYGGNSASAFALLDSELARQALRPNRVFSDGTALPLTFGDIRDHHTANSADSRINPNIHSTDRENDRKVQGFGASQPRLPTQADSSSTAPALSGIRDEVTARGVTIRRETGTARTTFEDNAGIVETSDGTLTSHKSLLKQAGKQSVDDAEATYENAKDIVVDLMKKEK